FRRFPRANRLTSNLFLFWSLSARSTGFSANAHMYNRHLEVVSPLEQVGLMSFREGFRNEGEEGRPDLASAHNPAAQRFGYRFGLGMHVQFLVDALHVEGNGVDADAQRGGGGLVVMAFGEKL